MQEGHQTEAEDFSNHLQVWYCSQTKQQKKSRAQDENKKELC